MEHAIKILERIVDLRLIKEIVKIDEMQHGFMQ